jgi:hypothetical protein
LFYDKRGIIAHFREFRVLRKEFANLAADHALTRDPSFELVRAHRRAATRSPWLLSSIASRFWISDARCYGRGLSVEGALRDALAESPSGCPPVDATLGSQSH